MKLWLDDERDPTDPFIQQDFNAEGDEIWVKTVPEAIELLKTGKVTYISFDHDLGTNETGYDLAKWIEEQAYNGTLPKLSHRIHTMNSRGYMDIHKAMVKANQFWNAK